MYASAPKCAASVSVSWWI